MTSRSRKPLTLILTLAFCFSGATKLFALDKAPATASTPQAKASQTQKPSTNAILSRDKLRRHVTTLASDEFKGRNPAGEGGLIAAKYLAAEFKKLGLKPAGDDGKYFQKFNKYQQPGFRWIGPNDTSRTKKHHTAKSGTNSSKKPSLEKTASKKGDDQKSDEEDHEVDDEEDITAPPAPMSEKEVQETAKKLADWLRQKMGPPEKGGWYECRNVLALLPGSDPKLKDEIIIICAHYDHFGVPKGVLYPGADDNASGTAAVVELARVFTNRKDQPRRSILFAAWDAEEKGLCGSRNWTIKPTLPIKNVVAVINMDMIGRLRGDRLLVLGYDSSQQLDDIISTHAKHAKIKLRKLKKFACSDHWPFFQKTIPSVTLCTGAHLDYHSPRDTIKMINFTGMRRVAQMTFDIVQELANREERVIFSGNTK